MLTAIAYVLIYFSGIFAALLSRPMYGIYTYLFAFYAYAPGRWWGESLPDLRWSLLAAAITLFAILKSKEPRIKLFEFRENRLFALFVVYISLQMLWVDKPFLHQEYVVLCIKFLLLMYLLQNSIRSTNDVIGFIIANLIGCTYFGYVGMFEHSGGRLEGIGTPGMESANQLAQHVGVILVCGAFLLLCDMGKKVICLYPFVLLTLNALLMTESRGGLIGVVVAGVYSLFVIPSSVKIKYYRYVILAFIALSIMVGPQIIDRFSTITAEGGGAEQDKSAESRLVIIKSQLKMFSNYPLLGYGHRGTLILSPLYIPEEYFTEVGSGESGRASHNLTMSMLVDHGLVGAFLYFSIVISCFLRVHGLKKIDESSKDIVNLKILLAGLSVGLVALMVASQGSSSKKLEIGLWLFALIPVLSNMIYIKSSILKNDVNDQQS